VPFKILNRRYKIGPDIDDRAKFHAGRPRHRGDLALKNKLVAKHKQPRNLVQSPTWVRPAP